MIPLGGLFSSPLRIALAVWSLLTHRPLEQNREPRNKPTHIWPTNLTKVPKMYNGERTASLINGVGKIGKSQAIPRN